MDHKVIMSFQNTFTVGERQGEEGREMEIKGKRERNLKRMRERMRGREREREK